MAKPFWRQNVYLAANLAILWVETDPNLRRLPKSQTIVYPFFWHVNDFFSFIKNGVTSCNVIVNLHDVICFVYLTNTWGWCRTRLQVISVMTWHEYDDIRVMLLSNDIWQWHTALWQWHYMTSSLWGHDWGVIAAFCVIFRMVTFFELIVYLSLLTFTTYYISENTYH